MLVRDPPSSATKNTVSTAGVSLAIVNATSSKSPTSSAAAVVTVPRLVPPAQRVAVVRRHRNRPGVRLPPPFATRTVKTRFVPLSVTCANDAVRSGSAKANPGRAMVEDLSRSAGYNPLKARNEHRRFGRGRPSKQSIFAKPSGML